jgi:hypothetical protein
MTHAHGTLKCDKELNLSIGTSLHGSIDGRREDWEALLGSISEGLLDLPEPLRLPVI